MRSGRSIAIIVALFIPLLGGCSAQKLQSRIPEHITLYLEEESRILTLDYSEYLTGCIFAAAEPSFQHETLLSVGIACSGQALYCMENYDHSSFYGADLSDDPDHFPEWISPEALEQEYGENYPEYLKKISAIAEKASAMYPEYSGSPANTVLCRISTGLTDNGGYPYLPPLALPCDKESPEYSGSCTLTDEIVWQSLSEKTSGNILPPNHEEWFTNAKYTDGGTLITVRFGNFELTGEQLSRALGLRSSAIRITYADGMFTFTSSGIGSNTGMSVYSAERLARGGQCAEDIIRYFYPGTDIVNTGQLSF